MTDRENEANRREPREQDRRDMREPEREGGRYEAQASGSATPVRERGSETRQERGGADQIDERAATTKTQPMAQLEGSQSRPPSEKGSDGSLMHDQRFQYFAGRWDSIQAGFVDDPRKTVEQADRLVGEVIDHLATIFKEERAKLESQWSRSGKADTEDLRIAIQRYREFFQTLVGR